MYSLEGSEEGFPDNFELFSSPAVDSSTQNTTYIDYTAKAEMRSGGIIEMYYQGKGKHYVSLKRSRIRMSLQITADDGLPIEDYEVGLINLPLYTCISQLDLSLQQTVISPYSGE